MFEKEVLMYSHQLGWEEEEEKFVLLLLLFKKTFIVYTAAICFKITFAFYNDLDKNIFCHKVEIRSYHSR